MKTTPKRVALPPVRESVRDKLDRGAYKNTKQFPSRHEKATATWAQMRHDHRVEEQRLYDEFKGDVLHELGLRGTREDGQTFEHPKADLFFEKMWDLGHAAGYEEVWSHAQEWVELLR